MDGRVGGRGDGRGGQPAGRGGRAGRPGGDGRLTHDGVGAWEDGGAATPATGRMMRPAVEQWLSTRGCCPGASGQPLMRRPPRAPPFPLARLMAPPQARERRPVGHLQMVVRAGRGLFHSSWVHPIHYREELTSLDVTVRLKTNYRGRFTVFCQLKSGLRI